ncbi:MAG: diphthine--ammonia ligase [archaeon]
MKLAVLFSGGKDSTMALHKVLKQGHDVTHLVSAFPKNPESMLYHTSNIELTKLAAEAIGIPLLKLEVESLEDTGEAAELEEALEKLDIEGIVVGGVSSKYQARIFSAIADKLGIEMIAPYWGKPHEELIREAIGAGYDIRITSVSADGLDENWLGRKLDLETLEELKKLKETYGVDIGGEGGEYCTVVVAGPIFKKRIKFLESEKVWEGMSGKLVVKKAELVASK